MVFNQISQPRQRVSLRIAFSELDALSGSKTSGCTTSPHLRFSNHGRSGGSQTISALLAIGCGSATVTDRAVLKRSGACMSAKRTFSNRGRSGGSQTRTWGTISTFCSATMADQVALKHAEMPQFPLLCSATVADQVAFKPVGVDMPFELGIPISKNCKICQVFLFLRPARSFFRSGSRISASVYSRPDGGMDTL